MNKAHHVLNAVGLALGLAVIRTTSGDVTGVGALESVSAEVILLVPPILAGTLLPDVDTVVGTHRKTLHNLAFLTAFVAYPRLFGNLHVVWVGIATHYVLDVLGTTRGIALFYPYPREFGVPVGVETTSPLAGVVTILITGSEIALAAGGVVVLTGIG